MTDAHGSNAYPRPAPAPAPAPIAPQIRTRLAALLAPEQPQVCERVDKMCAKGHANMLYSLATPAASPAHDSTRDKTGRSKLDFSTITPKSLGVAGSAFGNEWSRDPWPKFPLMMVNTIRGLCGCADLPTCDLHGKTAVLDPDAVRDAVAEHRRKAGGARAAASTRALVNAKDSLGYAPAALALMNNDALTFAALLETDALDFAAEDVWGRSLVQVLYTLTPTKQARAMHDAVSR
jgi:hypothetical protein